MASLVYAVWSITQVASVHCAARPEISPCSCEPMYASNYLELTCEKVSSFHQIVAALGNKFEPELNISLKITYSDLQDLEMRSFKDMNINIVKLRLQFDHLRTMPESPFRGLSNVQFLSIGDNDLEEIPKHMLNHMPYVKTLDIGRCRIRSVLHDDFKGVPIVNSLFLPGNNITRLEKGAFPTDMQTLHLGRNQIENLNGTLRELHKLESLFINMNNITTLDDELPDSNRLKLIIAQSNRIDHLPENMRYMTKLETVHLQHNRLKSLDGIFRNAKRLNQFCAYSNEIEYMAQDEFQSSPLLEELDLNTNKIKSLNSSLLPMLHLYNANFSYNELEEFSMHEIRGLLSLRQLDLSHNRIKKLTGRQVNNIDQFSFIVQFILDHNELKSLDGALMGLGSLRLLDLSYNKLEQILPEDFMGLSKLEMLDLSHNQLLTLKEMETTALPNLKVLKVAYNNLTKLERDFHGLPVLCQANLTNNQITTISKELVSKTKCKNHNVPGKLELHLDDNPIMCDQRLTELCPIMLSQDARIRGRSQCFEDDQEVCTVLQMLFPPPQIILTDKYPMLQLPGKTKMRVLVPNPILGTHNTEELPPIISQLDKPLINTMMKMTIATTTTAPTTTSTTATTTTASTSTTTTTTSTTPSTTSTSTTTTTTTAVPIIEKLTERIIRESKQNIEENFNNITNNTNVEIELPFEVYENVSNHTNDTNVDLNEVAAQSITSSTEKIEVTAPTETQQLVLDIEETLVAPTQVVGQTNVALTDGTNVGNDATNAAQSMEQHQPDYKTLEYIPNLDDFALGKQPPDGLNEDTKANSVQEEFPSVVLANLDNAPQSLLTPEEPPENP